MLESGLLAGLEIKPIIKEKKNSQIPDLGVTAVFLLVWALSICCEAKIFEKADKRMNVKIFHTNTQFVRMLSDGC